MDALVTSAVYILRLGGHDLKQVNLTVSFDDEKLRALNKYLRKKELTVDDELASALLHLYEKHVPAPVREYIDEEDVASPKPKKPAKTKKDTADIIQRENGGDESLASKYFGMT